MAEVKKTTILVSSIKRKGKKLNKEGEKIMTSPEESQALGKAFSGPHGVEEKSMLEILVKCNPADLTTFRKKSSEIFLEDERRFERWDPYHLIFLEKEFLRFHKAVIQWTMHPWERDARLVRKSLEEEAPLYNLLIELACTRTSEEFLGTRKAFHCLYDESIEEFVACRVEGSLRRLLVALVSVYRYEGMKVNEAVIQSECQKLGRAIKTDDKNAIEEDDEVLRILTTRSKPCLKTILKCYKERYDSNLVEDLEEIQTLRDTVNCLCAPPIYFSKILDTAMKVCPTEHEKEALTRVIVTRTDVDMKAIAEEFNKKYGATLTERIEAAALGNYRDFLVTLVERGMAN